MIYIFTVSPCKNSLEGKDVYKNQNENRSNFFPKVSSHFCVYNLHRNRHRQYFTSNGWNEGTNTILSIHTRYL